MTPGASRAASSTSFAAWTVEGRAPDQLLLADFMGRTKSWLMIASLRRIPHALYFGRAVVPARLQVGQTDAGTHIRLVGFHKLYSRILLAAAAAKFTTAAR